MQIRKRKGIIFLCIIAFTALAVPGLSAVPGQINYQGRLTDGMGVPVSNGTYPMRFYLFDAQNGGDQLWNMPHGEEQDVVVTDGTYNVQLGAVEPMDSSIFDGNDAWLEIAIYHTDTSTWETMSPRQRVTSVAYALKAEDADTLAGNAASAFAPAGHEHDIVYVNEGQANSVIGSMIMDYSIGANHLADGSTIAEILDDDGAESGLDADLLDGHQASFFMPAATDNWVNTTGDTMTGDLVVNSTTYGAAGYHAAKIVNSDSNFLGYGLLARGKSLTGHAQGIRAEAEGDLSATGLSVYCLSNQESANGIDMSIYAGAESESPSHGIRNNVYHSASGTASHAFGYYNFTDHYGSQGDAYGFYGNVYGSNTGNSYGAKMEAYKWSSDTEGSAYGGFFKADNDRSGGNSYGLYSTATGLNGPRYGHYAKATTSGAHTHPNYGVYSETSNSNGPAYGFYSNTDSSNFYPSYGYYADVAKLSGATGDLYGLHVSTFRGGVSGNSFGIDSLVTGSDAGTSYGGKFYVQHDNAADTGLLYALHAQTYAPAGSTATRYAGYFVGNVNVSGNLSKSSGSFKIDHPLDPENKYLQHSFVESPDMLNIYNGNVILDKNGEAIVELPHYFEALNMEFRYQLTCLGGFAPVYIAREVEGNSFGISGGHDGLKVSWQVTGIRQDAWAQAHRIEVEIDKPEEEQGTYLAPEVFGRSEEFSVEKLHQPKDRDHTPPKNGQEKE